jgi:hypothetical protein
VGFLSRVVERWRATPAQRPMRSRPAYAGPCLDYARHPEAGWQAALDAATLTGDGTHVARLWLHWVPGDPWQPVHRWFLFQLQPWAHVAPHIQMELRGPHPRTNATLHYTPRVIAGKLEQRPRITGGPCRFIDRTQWAIHRQIEREQGVRVFPRYHWVIQGDMGGHPFMITDEEQALRSLQGLPADVPSAGDLPYAPFDQRVVDALSRYDLWKYAHGLGDPITAHAQAQIRRQIATEQYANRMLWARKEAVAQEVADGLAFAARQDGLHYHRWRPVGQKARRIDMDAMKDHYVQDTSLSD